MKITRWGARANNGPNSIFLNDISVSCKNEGVVLKDNDIEDFYTSKTHYNYEIILSYNEIAKIVEALGNLQSDQKQIGKAFEPKLKSLLKIVLTCIYECH